MHGFTFPMHRKVIIYENLYISMLQKYYFKVSKMKIHMSNNPQESSKHCIA